MAGRHALLIATETYADPALRRLTAPGGDARALAEVLSDPAIAGFEVTTLVDQPHHIVGEAIGEFYRGRRRDELTLLYFTGHGVKDDDGRLYLAMANTRRDSLMFTALAAEQVDRALAGCASQQKVLVLDCCYSGAFPAGKLAKAGTDVHTLERFQGRGRAVLTASDATQYSFEGDAVVGSAARSVFTRHLVAGLRDGSADLDHDGDVTVDELYSYVHEHVVAEMPRQRPKHQSDVEGRIVLARNPRWTLPEYLRHGLASPIASDRLTALEGLRRLNRVGNEVVRARTETEIHRLVDDDSRTVSAAALAWVVAAAEIPVAEMSASDVLASDVLASDVSATEMSVTAVPVTEMSVAEVLTVEASEVADELLVEDEVPVIVEPVESAVEEVPVAVVAEVPVAERAALAAEVPVVKRAAVAAEEQGVAEEPVAERVAVAAEMPVAPSVAPVAEAPMVVPTASAVQAAKTLAAELSLAEPSLAESTAAGLPMAKPEVPHALEVVPSAAKPDPVVPTVRKVDLVPPAEAKTAKAAQARSQPRPAGPARTAGPAGPAGPSVKRTAPPAPDVPDGSASDARFYLVTAGLIVALAIGILLAVGVVNWIVLLLLLLFAVFLGLGVAHLRRQSK